MTLIDTLSFASYYTDMPDDSNTAQNPPIGDHQQAEKYLNQLISAIKQDTYTLTHSDLSKFDPCSFQDHYRIDMGTYHAEISHSKHPQSGADVYALIFTSIDKIRAGQSNQAILSYLPLTSELFAKFKSAADDYFAEQKRRAEEKRFKEAMKPVDALLNPLHPDNRENQDNRDNRDNRDNELTNTPNHSQFFHDFTPNPNADAKSTPPSADLPKN